MDTKRLQELAGIESIENIYIGTLHKEEFNEDEVYYVDIPELGNIIVSNKLIDKIGKEMLDSLVGKEEKWDVIEYNSLSNNPQEKYRVIDIKR
jgi:hypothetical protein